MTLPEARVSFGVGIGLRHRETAGNSFLLVPRQTTSNAWAKPACLVQGTGIQDTGHCLQSPLWSIRHRWSHVGYWCTDLILWLTEQTNRS